MNKKSVLPFSPAVVKGGFIFTSGQAYLTPEGKLPEMKAKVGSIIEERKSRLQAT